MSEGPWTKARVEALIDGRAPEGRRLEYKVELPGPADADKREFLKDITSFANTSGGALMFGVEGERDGEGKTTGAPARAAGLRNWNRDQVVQRLENLLLTGVSPRLFGVRFGEVPGFVEGPVLAVGVARSFSAPHRVTLGGGGHFYARNDGGAYPMDVNELRGAFLGGRERANTLHQFRLQRARLVEGDEPVVAMGEGPKLLLHVVPLSVTGDAIAADLRGIQPPAPLCATGFSNWRYNMDGVVCWDRGSSEAARAYTLVFRSGIVEGAAVLETDEGRGSSRWFSLTWVESQLAEAYARYAETLRALRIEGPVAVMVSIVGARGILAMTEVARRSHPIDRQELFIPDAVVEELGTPAKQALGPVFELLGMACGVARPTKT